ncbi:caspase family protein [Haliscomenobacter hydrossis]|uniref:Peptidase C14 caspase catalytic subunit p20 n=1 Tax=Haliscomenobacter hydrossis (strain ATCC 27775 / DSM 1100 / LMG 10767 / O) TaxID=760192 RepID=F4KUW5_HALH1|nr:caspase family protein [Haliscomenobacter hydrossis]AEE48141.1 peptidase C14 caspase catalytic subunit p20 [Haliscomenobacter hydrossis DSM 1100]
MKNATHPSFFRRNVLYGYALLLALCYFLPGPPLTAQSETAPILSLNMNMHTADIKRISVDNRGRKMLSVSKDKTAKLWDIATGALLRTFRSPIGAEDEGALYAGAISPDGRWVALGGWTGKNSEDKNIYLFDVASGEMVKRLSGLPDVVFDIEYSPDGRYLAATLGSEGLLVWRCSDWTLFKTDEDYAKDAYNLAFDAWGRLATVCDDGYLRVYKADFTLEKKIRTTGGKEPFSLAFSPNGQYLALGYSDSPTIQVLDARSLELLYAPNISAASTIDDRLMIVAFSADGQYLAAGGFYSLFQDGAWWHQVRVWQDAGKGAYTDYQAADNSILDIKALPMGGFVFGGSQPDWGGFDPGVGQRTHYAKVDVFNYGAKNKSHFRLGGNGEEIGITPVSDSPLTFVVPTRHLSATASVQPTFFTERNGLKLSDWSDARNPKLNGKTLTFLDEYENCYCVDIANGGGGIVLGTDWYIRLCDALGQERWNRSVPSAAWCVKIDALNRVVAAGLGDGTICWYNYQNGQPLLSLFIHPDRKRWVLWTPSGYYDAAPGAEEFLGWHLNQGQDKAAEFYPLSKFRSTYHRPDVIDLILETLDEAEALRQANAAAGKRPQSVGRNIVQELPPTVRIHSPSDGTEVTENTVRLQYSIDSPNAEPITSLRIQIDGRPVSTERGFKPLAQRLEATVVLPNGKCQVSIIAENRFGTSVPATLNLVGKRVATPGPGFELRPKLYVLAIGVSKYSHKDINKLDYAAKDANDFVACVRKQKGLLYHDVVVKTLTEAQASKDSILNGFDWLVSQTTSRDVAMLFFAGHGVDDNSGNFYYLPANANPEELRRSAVSQGDVQSTVRSVAGKILVFMDACHSGSLMRPIMRRSDLAPDIAAVVNELSAAENGAITFSSATTREFALEDPSWQNGAFTKALVEGLSGKAVVPGQNRITVKSLDAYVSERVKVLTNGKQHPATVFPPNVPDFPIGMVK